jgi:hypothetical protein
MINQKKKKTGDEASSVRAASKQAQSANDALVITSKGSTASESLSLALPRECSKKC